MRFIKIIIILTLFLISCKKNKNTLTPHKITSKDSTYIKEFNQYWKTIDESFAYFGTQKTNWKKVKSIYKPIANTIKNRNNFISLLEKCNNELYNGHIGLNTNLSSSSKLIPSDTDIWIIKQNNKYIIESIRENSIIEKSKLKIGMEILKFNDVEIHVAVKEFLPKSFTNYDNEVYEFAVNTLLAGKHNISRTVLVKINNLEESIKLNYSKAANYYPNNNLLSSQILENNVGYIKINNSLGNIELIKQFDRTLDKLMNTNSLILDLRETPSGGNNTVAKAIMGRFINSEKPYQRYQYVYDEKETDIKQIWTELVIPRNKFYAKPMVVLVGRWTGSMGEGITIGFDSFKRAEIVGTKMARLLGAVWNYQLNESKISFQIPGIKLFHINKTPREDFIPKNYTNKNLINEAKKLLD